MTNIRFCVPKTHAELAMEWDKLAAERHRQIASGEDLSFDHVVVPASLDLFEAADASVVLDIGSGTGDFTARLARVAKRVIGVDPSAANIAIARSVCREMTGVQFVQSTLEEAGVSLRKEKATAAIAVMSLMTTPDLKVFARTTATVLERGARFIATLCHPCFWPRYWGYDSNPWFSYSKEIFIEAPFVISGHRTDIRTTHIHRPLDRYVDAFSDAGFMLEALVEPMPPVEIQNLYPAPWAFPRFLGLRWVKAM